MAMATVVVKAEIHQNEGGDIVPHICTTPKIEPKQKKRASDSESILLTADVIEVISSENVSSPPKSEANSNNSSTPKRNSPFNNNVTPTSNRTPKNKPKWAMKIKLSSTEDDNSDVFSQDLDSTTDEDLFTPRCRLKLKDPESTKSKVKSEEKCVIKDKSKLKKERLTKSNSESPPKKSKIPLKVIKSESPPIKEKKEPLKPAKAEKLAPIFTRKRSTKENNEVVVIEESLKRKTTEKLAPLFVKRHKPDPEVIAARRHFLQPEIVDLTDQGSPPKAPIAPILSPLLFPKISHVTQLEQTFKKTEFKANFVLKPLTKYKPLLNVNELKSVNSYETITCIIENKIEEITDAEAEVVVNEMQARCENAVEIWGRISKFGKKSEYKNGELKKQKKRGRPKKRNLEAEENEIWKEEDPLRGMLWTSKYKPTISKEVIGNENAVKKLRDWLNGWRSKVENKEQSNSDDDFYSSDCSRSSFIGKNQVAILIGPHGCGKTSSIYAVAEELGYRVIEVNASSKRSGKKLLKDFEEATKSHRIRNQSMESFGFGATKTLAYEKSIPKNSLILFDDIDLMFEEDDGFMNSVFQLASNTKRPIAMTCRNTFSQLSKFAPQQLRINFEAVPSKKASIFLELVSLAETRHKLPVSFAETLTITGDLRKALLQLQYLLLSGRALSAAIIENPRPSMWKEMHIGLYRPVIKATKSNKRKTREQKTNKKIVSDSIDSSLFHKMASSIDNLSLISSLSTNRDVVLEPKERLLEDSLSLVEKMSNYCSSDLLGSEIHEWLTQKTIERNGSIESKDIANLSSLLGKKNINEGVNIALSQTAALTLDQRAIATDYLPYVRAICRTEEIRQNSNAKRGNRFYHYLQGIVTLRPHSFTAACKMFQEKSNDKT